MSIILISISNGSPLPQSGNYNRPIKTRNRFLDFFKNPSLQSGTPNRQFETGNRLFDLFFLPEILFFLMLLAICLEVETIEIVAHVLNNQAEQSFILDHRLSDEFLYNVINMLLKD